MPKHAGGRPTDYKPEYVAFVDIYLKKYEELGDVVPTVEGLADELGVGKKTLYNWADANEEFLHALDKLKAKQGRLLQSKGLNKETDSSITKLMLSANHGMAEKIDQDHTSKGEKLEGIAVQFVRAPKN